jgi:hypothetical protein
MINFINLPSIFIEPGDLIGFPIYKPRLAAVSGTGLEKWFLGPLGREKSPKVSALESESSRRGHDSARFLSKIPDNRKIRI